MLQSSSIITPQVVRSLNPALVRYATRFMRRTDAEDAVQETWLCALRHESSVRDTAALQSWLRTILRRRIVDQRRKRGRVAPLDIDIESPSDDEPTARHDLAGAQVHITSGLSRLSPLEREAICLVDVSDVDRDLAATQLKVSRGHLRVLLHRGRARLNQHLTRHGVCA